MSRLRATKSTAANAGKRELRTGLFVRLLPWPSKDNVEVKVGQNKALCGALVGQARIT